MFDILIQVYIDTVAIDHLRNQVFGVRYARGNNIRKRSWFKAEVLLGESTHISLIRAFLPNIQAFLPNGPHTYLILTS